MSLSNRNEHFGFKKFSLERRNYENKLLINCTISLFYMTSNKSSPFKDVKYIVLTQKGRY